MAYENKWSLNREEKQALMAALTPHLGALRTKADISQDELSNFIGVSRQTYGAMERGTQKLTWNTYLSLILFYDYNKTTHDMIRNISAFPYEIVLRINQGGTIKDPNLQFFFGDESRSILEHLDAQAIHAIRTVILLEYARSVGISGDRLIQMFNGTVFSVDCDKNEEAAKVLNAFRPSGDPAKKKIW